MGTAALAPSLFDQCVPAGPDQRADIQRQAHPDPVGGSTLEDVILAAWQALTRSTPAACPVCQGVLQPVWSAGPRPVGGCCQDCGSRLS